MTESKPRESRRKSAQFTKLYLSRAEHCAISSPAMPLPQRLHLLAMSRKNRRGHAEFPSGSLLGILTKPNGDRFSEQHMRTAIRQTAEWGLLAPVSNIRCLVVPIEVAAFGFSLRGKPPMCREHGTSDAWTVGHGGGWIDLAYLTRMSSQESAEWATGFRSVGAERSETESFGPKPSTCGF